MTGAMRSRILITGAASGIGAACATALATTDARLVLTDVTVPPEPPASDQIEWVAADLTDADQLAALVARTGPLQGLVHCAGILRMADPATMAPDVWDLVMNVNLTATFRLMQGVLPNIIEGASIVLMSSISAKWAATPEAVAYAASKAAILSLTRSFATYFATRKVRINAICPGIIETPMNRTLLRDVAAERGVSERELEDRRIATIPMGRVGEAAEVASVALFLLSPASAYMTGQSLNVNGGTVTH